MIASLSGCGARGNSIQMDLAAACSLAYPLRRPFFPGDLRQSGRRRSPFRADRARIMAASSGSGAQSATLVTFLGKGGSGKTTAAVLAAMYYAKQGLKTCLVVHSQDLSADELLVFRIGTTPTSKCSDNLSVVRLETSKMLLEPLDRMKKVDTRLNLTQGILEGWVVGEEFGVLPGMDSTFVALALQNLVNFLPPGKHTPRNNFDVVVYDGISSEETLRLIGAPERARSYLKYARDVAEKTDLGRLAGPSLLKLAYESADLNGRSSDGKTSSEIWNIIEHSLEKASAAYTDSSKFRCYLVADPSRAASVKSALRYWGCTIQAGAQISGAFGVPLDSTPVTTDAASASFSPLVYALMPHLSAGPSLDWDSAVASLDESARDLLCSTRISLRSPVRFDPARKSVILFLPGFNKSEIKLYQFRGGTELLVEAGDQRGIIRLPSSMQGKVGGAKFIDQDLVVSLR